MQRRAFSGPIPPPEALEKYNRVLPTAAERIMAMAESQSAHRQKMETRVIESVIRRSYLGLTFGFILGLLVVTAGIVLIYLGRPIEGSVVSGSTIVGLVSTFIYGTKTRREQIRQKQEQ